MSHCLNGMCTEKETLNEIKAMVQKIHDNMFVGNGTPSMMVRIAGLEARVSAASLAVGSLFVAALISGAGYVFFHIFKAV